MLFFLGEGKQKFMRRGSHTRIRHGMSDVRHLFLSSASAPTLVSSRFSSRSSSGCPRDKKACGVLALRKSEVTLCLCPSSIIELEVAATRKRRAHCLRMSREHHVAARVGRQSRSLT